MFYSDIFLIQGYAFTCIWEKNENFQNFMYNIYDKLWGDDITNSLIWIFIRTGQEIVFQKKCEISKCHNFLISYPIFIIIAPICREIFYSFFWNYGNSGLDFPFKLPVVTYWYLIHLIK